MTGGERSEGAAHTDRTKAGTPGGFAYLLLLVMGLLWGFALSLAKIAAVSGAHPFGLALWQVLVSGSLVLVIALLHAGLPKPSRGLAAFSLFCGGFGVAVPAILLFWSAIYLPAGVVAIAFASMPLFTYLFSVLFGVETGTRRRLLGVFIGFAAMALLILPETALPEPGLAPWVLLGLVASVSMSLENFYAGGFRPAGLTSPQLSCARQFGAVLYLAPLALLTDSTLPLAAPWGPAQWAATGMGITSGIAYTLLLVVIRTSGPVFASQTAYVITLAGVAWGLLLFGERHSLFIWAALALTLLGIALVSPRLPRYIGRRARAAGSD